MEELTESDKAIFRVAVSLTETAERDRFLRRACADNDMLLRQLKRLLDADDVADSMLRSPSSLSDWPHDKSLPDTPTDQVGEYKLLQRIGEGGFGVVYMAEQQLPVARKVALKIVKAGMDTKQVVARFNAERHALSLMDHPHIAKVLDGGTTATGRPFFVMELVRGIAIAEFCDQRRLSISERLSLFLDICRAIQHAHQKGIIHRDLKPSNILVSLQNGRPVLKVIDFGIAKALHGRLTDATLFTRFEQLIGTPAYMSPEQAGMDLDIDTRSDIYSLGVLLYELLTGQLPFGRQELSKGGFEELRQRIEKIEPPIPSARLRAIEREVQVKVSQSRSSELAHLLRQLSGDLDWIVMRAMEKDRSRRYETSSALADDIQRYLRQETVAAAPPSAVYRFRKFTNRNRATLSFLTTIAMILIVATTFSTLQAIHAMKASAAVQRGLYVAEMAAAKREFDELNTQGAVAILERYTPQVAQADLRGFEWRWLWNQCHQDAFQLTGHQAKLRDLRFSGDGKWLATASKDGTARLWNLETEREVWKFRGGYHCNLVDVSPDGTLLLTDFWSPQQNQKYQPSTLLWDIRDHYHPKQVDAVPTGGRFSPDGKALYAVRPGRVYDLSGNFMHRIADGAEKGPLGGRYLSKDRKVLLTENEVWDVASGTLAYVLPEHGGAAVGHNWDGAAVSPADPNRIATSCAEGVRIWNRGNLIAQLDGTAGTPISGLDFSMDGSLLAVRQTLGAIRVYDTNGWNEIATFRAPAGETLAFSPTDNDLLITGGEDGVVRGWKVSPKTVPDAVFDHPDTVLSLEFSPDGRILAVGMNYGAVWFWDVQDGKPVLKVPPKPEPTWEGRYHSYSYDFVAFTPNSRHVAVIGPKDAITIWDMEQREKLQTIKLPRDLPSDEETTYWSVEFSHDGRHLYTGIQVGSHGLVEVWEWATPQETNLRRHDQHSTKWTWHRSMAASPDGRLLATTALADYGPDNESTLGSVWKLPEMEVVHELTLNAADSEMLNLSFSPDSTRLAITGDPPGVTIWDTATWRPTAQLRHVLPPDHISWSHDGTRLASSDATATTKLWDIETSQVVATFNGAVVEFSPDGSLLAVGRQSSAYLGDDKLGSRVTLHHAPPLEEIDNRRGTAK